MFAGEEAFVGATRAVYGLIGAGGWSFPGFGEAVMEGDGESRKSRLSRLHTKRDRITTVWNSAPSLSSVLGMVRAAKLATLYRWGAALAECACARHKPQPYTALRPDKGYGWS